MDLEGVGALAAAVVAAVAIPSALIVGRWQMRGTIRTAEETGRAGIAQAEASYRAALDAVKSQADETHTQWRRSLRREAYVNLLLRAQQIEAISIGGFPEALEGHPNTESISKIITALEDAKTALMAAGLVTSLEGPPEVSNKASNLVQVAVRQANYNKFNAIALRSLTALKEVAREGGDTGRAVSDFLSKAEFAHIELNRYLRSEPPLAEDRSEFRNAENEALVSGSNLPGDLASKAFTYMRWLLRDNPQELPRELVAQSEYRTAKQDFLDAARSVLDDTVDEPRERDDSIQPS